MRMKKLKIDLTNLFVLVLTLSVSATSIYKIIEINKKIDDVVLKGTPVINKQMKLISSMQEMLGEWLDQIDRSVIKSDRLALKVNRKEFKSMVSELSENQKKLTEYMTAWRVDLQITSGHNEILKFLYSNPLDKIEDEKTEVLEKIFLKRKITDFNNMFSYYRQMVIHENEKIVLRINSQDNLKLALIFGCFISSLLFLVFSFYSYQSMKANGKGNKKFNVLFVDDDDDILEVLAESSHALKNCNFLQASDGLEALAILKKERVDLLVTDLSMPNMGGVELIEKLKSLDVPVIVMTSRDILSTEARRLLKGQHIYDKFDFLCRMDQIIGIEIGRKIKEFSHKKAS